MKIQKTNKVELYKLTNLKDGKSFIVENINKNESFSYEDNRYFRNAIRIYGEKNFSVERICCCKRSAIRRLKEFFIKKYKTNSFKYGYNLLDFHNKFRILTYQRLLLNKI